MAKTYIIGHTKPDTDAVVAAMALEYLFSQEDCFGYSQAVAAITDPLNPETSFLFSKFAVSTPQIISASSLTAEDKVVLVDHNESSQRLDGLNESQIVEIIDHHKVNLNLGQPIFMTFKAWGSSSTIVYHMMQQCKVKPDKTLAALMLSAILSDTVGFKSATTTPKDIELGQELAGIAGITDTDTLALEIFKAKSDISSLTDEQIVKNDYKIFEFGKKTMIDQLETVEQDLVLTTKKADLLEAMQKIKTELKVELLFVAITDVLKINTKLLILGDEEAKFAQMAFGGQVVDNILDIGPKMSRKKEIAPFIEKALA
jgi:manganese-dependent inorganic pyrophosphatase